MLCGKYPSAVLFCLFFHSEQCPACSSHLTLPPYAWNLHASPCHPTCLRALCSQHLYLCTLPHVTVLSQLAVTSMFTSAQCAVHTPSPDCLVPAGGNQHVHLCDPCHLLDGCVVLPDVLRGCACHERPHLHHLVASSREDSGTVIFPCAAQDLMPGVMSQDTGWRMQGD